MTYVVSNLHGNFEKYSQLLKTVHFTDSDVLYVLGDIVDYGEDSAKLISDMSVRWNVYPVAGEHDFCAVRMLKKFDKMLKSGGQPDADYVTEMTAWVKDGGAPTLEAFRALDEDGKEGFLEYLEDMALFEEVTVGGKDYLLLHKGIANYEKDADLEDYEAEDFFSADADVSKMNSDCILVAGHFASAEGRIKKEKNRIFVNCGMPANDTLGCLRLEDGKEFYV